MDQQQRQNFLLDEIRRRPEHRDMAPDKQQQAAVVAETHFTGLNWDVAIERGVDQVRFGIPFPKV